MQPNSPYQSQPRFSPRDHFPQQPYPRVSPRFYQHSPTAHNQWTQRSPNQEFCNRQQESPSSDSGVLDAGYIPLNLSGSSSTEGSPFKQSDSPYGDNYNHHNRPHFRDSYNNRRPWSGGPRWNNNSYNNRKNRPHQGANYSPNFSPNRGNFMQTADIKQYISAEFLKDPWRHLSKKDFSDSTPCKS